MTDICDCDVHDKEALAIFRTKRANWKSWLLEDPLCVSNQRRNMLWNDAIFRTFNEARRLTISRRSDALGFNKPLVDLIDNEFVDSQVMAIRRLTDPNFYDPKKAVLSLPRLIEDMHANIDIFTRENYISYDGSKYNGSSYGTHEQRLYWKLKQEIFDRLSNVSPSDRSRVDRVHKNVFKSLKKKLKICDNLRTYANKFIAHAADPKGRLKLTSRQKKITLNNLDRCYRAIICVGSFIGGIILYEESHSIGQVETPLVNLLKNLDKPMVSQDDFANLQDYWHSRVHEIGLWNQDPWAILS